ncbi:MAG: ribosome biogenesis GTP-binding protein YsxC [Candidatus Moranbacteria bacterium]|nr:ribosome biogenesis GTP-binding protein YsxC [Candidatus Moranbacteria bacterium]
MKIHSAKFIKGVIGSEGLPEPSRPTVAFFGRSNVGKSSVINSIVQRKDLAHSNSRAGRTTEINYFLVNDSWYIADLPGYGYAKLPETLRIKLGKYLSWYAADMRINLTWAVLVVDAEVGAKNSDRETFALLKEYGRKVLILANKSDKGKRNDVTKNIYAFKSEFPGAPVIRYSAKTGDGRNDLLDTLWPEY